MQRKRPLRAAMPQDLSTMAGRLCHARLTCELSQAELAEQLSRRTGKATSKPTVSKWEAGLSKNPEISTFFALAALTGFSAEWLATGKGQMRYGTPAAHALDANALRAAVVSVFAGATEHQLKTVSTLYAIVAAGASIDPGKLEQLAAAAG